MFVQPDDPSPLCARGRLVRHASPPRRSTLAEPLPSDLTAAARAAEALAQLSASREEVEALRAQLLEAQLRVERVLEENRRLAVDAERAARDASAAQAQARRLAEERTSGASSPPEEEAAPPSPAPGGRAGWAKRFLRV